VSTAFLEEEMGTTRKNAARIVTVCCMLLGIFCSFSLSGVEGLQFFGMSLFGLFDFVTGQLLLPFVGFLTCILIGWFVPHKIVRDEFTNWGTLDNVRLFHIYLFLAKYVCPICIMFIFLHQFGWL
jgi:NSS family neurotransmitter:Na+ symporter